VLVIVQPVLMHDNDALYFPGCHFVSKGVCVCVCLCGGGAVGGGSPLERKLKTYGICELK
jgi:hypothetical protein